MDHQSGTEFCQAIDNSDFKLEYVKSVSEKVLLTGPNFEQKSQAA